MKGFLKRDFYLLAQNLRFYLIFILVLGLVSFKSDIGTGFISLYVVVFCSSSMLGLFNYDEQGHWQAYAAAIPDGRRKQVDARYLLCMLVGASCVSLLLLVGLLIQKEDLSLILIYCGVFLLYEAIVLPLSYYFGAKSRLILLIIIAAMVGGIGAGGSVLILSTAGSGGRIPALDSAALPLILIGLAAMLISHRISLAVMARKDL